MALAASSNGAPSACAAAAIASGGVRPPLCSALNRTQIWMPKSTPSPTNSGMNATEIRLNRPTASNPTALVTTSPATIVARIAPTSRTDRVANHNVASIATSMTAPTTPILSSSVANSSSDNGTSPVS